MSYFTGPKNQFNSYWREGMFDMCKAPMNEFMFCMKLKFAEKEEAKVSKSHGPVQQPPSSFHRYTTGDAAGAVAR